MTEEELKAIEARFGRETGDVQALVDEVRRLQDAAIMLATVEELLRRTGVALSAGVFEAIRQLAYEAGRRVDIDTPLPSDSVRPPP